MSNKKERSKKSLAGPGIDLDFSGALTTYKFLQSNAFVRGLMGPVGSGKSYACAAEIMMRAVRQKPSPIDGIRYTRFVIGDYDLWILKTEITDCFSALAMTVRLSFAGFGYS